MMIKSENTRGGSSTPAWRAAVAGNAAARNIHKR